MEFRGAYDSSVTYNVGDVVKYGGVWYHLQKAAPAGTAPVDTLYWSRLSGVVAEAAELVDDAVNSASSEINEAKEAAEEAAASAAAAYGTDLLADDYSTSGTYAVGDYVIHSGGLYRCTTAIASGETWTDAHWAEVAIADDVSSLKSAIDASEVKENLLRSEMPGTSTTVTMDSNGNPTSIVHTANSETVRTDSFVWGTGTVTETRTLADGTYITITTNLDTLAQTISAVQEVA